MVYPAYELEFKIGTAGSESAETDMKTISDMETIEPSFDNGIEEWNPYDAEGWVKRLMTSKSLTVSLSGKRNAGDAGNDYLAGLAMKNGNYANTVLEIIFPDGGKLRMGCVASVTTIGGGDATSVSGLVADLQSNGKPTYTEA